MDHEKGRRKKDEERRPFSREEIMCKSALCRPRRKERVGIFDTFCMNSRDVVDIQNTTARNIFCAFPKVFVRFFFYEILQIEPQCSEIEQTRAK